MIRIPLLLIIFWFQDEPAFKSKEDFEVKLNLSFKQRTHDDDSGVHLNESAKDHERRTTSAMLPYLNMNVRILKIQPEEVKVKVTKDDRSVLLNKKLSESMEIKLDAGFTDDIKDGLSGFKHELHFFSPEKKVVSRILIEFDKDGNYFVNGEKRGKL